MYIGLHVKYLLFLSDFNKLEFSQDFPKILRYQISWKFIQWELSSSMRITRQMDGQTDMTMVIVAFHNFENVPTNLWNSYILHLDTVRIVATSSPRHWPLYSQGQPQYLMHWGLGGLDTVLAKMFLSLLEVKLQPTITVTLQWHHYPGSYNPPVYVSG